MAPMSKPNLRLERPDLALRGPPLHADAPPPVLGDAPRRSRVTVSRQRTRCHVGQRSRFSNACPSCGNPLNVTSDRIGKRPHRFEDLAFQCDACGVGFSNSSNPAGLRRIYRDPRDNVPPEVRDGLLEVLGHAVNVRNRPAKRFKFGSSRSEDALIWTIFEGLRKSGRLDAVLPPTSRTLAAASAPVVLAWGHPVAGNDADHVADVLQAVSHELGENPRSRSEPDMVLPWSSLIVFVEVKLDSANDLQPEHKSFPRYVDQDRDLYAAPDGVATTGFYELTRNWTTAVRLAAVLGRPMLLVNLGPAALDNDADIFSSLLVQDDRRRFAHRTWDEVLEDAAPLAPWLTAYIRCLGLPAAPSGGSPRSRLSHSDPFPHD